MRCVRKECPCLDFSKGIISPRLVSQGVETHLQLLHLEDLLRIGGVGVYGRDVLVLLELGLGYPLNLLNGLPIRI